jgi:hypothetical protein
MKLQLWRVLSMVMQRGGVKGDIGYSFGDLSADFVHSTCLNS